jgi:type II secretory pathway component PulM
MFNVLTDTLKKDIIAEYHKRRLIVWLGAVCLLQISFLIFLAPSFVYLMFKERALQVQDVQNKAQDALQNKANSVDGVALVQSTQAVLSLLSAHLPQGSVNATLARLISLKGPSISLQEISTMNQTASTSQVTVHGIALTREALLAFSQRLEADQVFSNIALPVSAFAKDSNISFSLTMSARLSSL